MSIDQLYVFLKGKKFSISGYNYLGIYWEKQVPESVTFDTETDTDTLSRIRVIKFNNLHGDTGIHSDKLSLFIRENEVNEIKKENDLIEINCGPSVIKIFIE
jgi:hypothetical protein